MATLVSKVMGAVGVLAALTACRSWFGGPRVPTITLAGDVSCPLPPPAVTGTATLGGGGTVVTVTVNVTCNGIPIQGVVLTGEIPTPTQTLTFAFPPTDANGNTARTDTLPGAVVVSTGDRYDVRVKDGSGNPTPPDPVGITIQ